jgi:hypothetical protein
MGFQKIGKVLTKISANKRDKQAMDASLVVEMSQKILEGFYSVEVCRHAKVKYYQKGVVWVETDASVVSAEVGLQKVRFIEQLRRDLEGFEVKDVRCRVR